MTGVAYVLGLIVGAVIGGIVVYTISHERRGK